MLAIDLVATAAERGDINRVGEVADRAREILGTASDRIRSLAFELAPPLLEAGGLRSALPALAATADPVPLTVTVGEQLSRYPGATESLVYRSVFSLVAVLRRRPNTSWVQVWVDDLGWAIEAVLRNDGESPGRLEPNVIEVGERVRVVGGYLEVDSADELRLRVPAQPLVRDKPSEADPRTGRG
jgi:signal transduction histidine kinase